MKRNDFCVFIASYKRPTKVRTVKSLLRANYTGPYYIVLGDDDPSIAEYENTFGKDKIIIFSKQEYVDKIDTYDNFGPQAAIVYFRNACFDFAKKLGYKYFLELDDDYNNYRYRYLDSNAKLRSCYVREFDECVDLMIDFFETSGATTVAFGQGGDYIGGCDSMLVKQRIRRKAMNSFFCSVDRPFEFPGTINEDVNAYCALGSKGQLFMTIADMALDQAQTQAQDGGMTVLYLDVGTYVKSFYSVISSPSFVRLGTVGFSHPRIHHEIDWDHGVPCILNEEYKKK